MANGHNLSIEGIDSENNTVLKTIRSLEKQDALSIIKSLSTKILRSGLGGASSNAASLLLHLNEAEGIGLNCEELMVLGMQIGMDVPFFLSGYEVARGTHYGEIITPLPALPKISASK